MTSRRSALVTGATSGIGVAICNRIVNEGVFVNAVVRNASLAADVLGPLVERGMCQIVVSDLSQHGESARVIESTKDDNLELVVNNAGGVLGEPNFVEGVVNDGELIYRLNVLVPYELSILAASEMTAGSIVNITSVNAHSVMVGAQVPLYSSSKAALAHQTKILARQLAPHVRVNAVSPN